MSIVDLLGEFDAPRVHTYGKPHVSQEGMGKINDLLDKRYDLTIPRGFAPLLETSRGRVAGRIEKFMRDYHDKKIPAIVKQDIGNIVELYALKGSSYIYDFTNEVLSWDNGSFGNSGSCWRNTHASSLPMFLAGTGYGPGFTIRTFEPNIRSSWYDGMRGKGRCWIMPYKENRIVMFNAYGERLPVFLSIVLSCLPEGAFSTKEVKVTNSTDGIYMNNGMGTAVHPATEKQSERLRLDMPKHYTVECKHCGQRYGSTENTSMKYCEECRGYCDVTGKAQSKGVIANVSDINVSYADKSYHIVQGRVGETIQKGLWFCHECLKWRGDLDEC